jgi:hypothetical protein
MEVAEAVPAVAIDEAPQTVEGVVARDGVKVVVHTIRGFLPQGPRDPPHHLERRDGRIGRDICPPASPGNGKGPPRAGIQRGAGRPSPR